MPDADGYPTDEELDRISGWPSGDPAGWLAFVKACWWAADWGWTEGEETEEGRRQRVYMISTGGWSGNEALLGAMKQHFVLWSLTWHEHRRGGHYVFRAPLEGEPG